MRIEEFCSEPLLWVGRSEPPPVIHNEKTGGIAARICEIIGQGKEPDENDSGVRYGITARGIYHEQVVGVPRTTYMSHTEFRTVRIQRESNGTGTLICVYLKPFSQFQQSFRMLYLRDYKTAYEILMQARRAAQEAAGREFVQEYGVLGDLPEETVADLQAELFGADAALQGAFPDPTVNPLPKLPEVQQNPAGEFTPHSR
ncbi:MAG: hypothetical protein J6Z40_01695 [Oscillospiraceae bacterium]|nr:hypothetical protein [Oscillospiraceae bacterium]